MCDPRATFMLRLCLFTLTCLAVTDCRLLQPRRPDRRADNLHNDKVQTNAVQHKKLSEFEIPNREFCQEMILRPEDHYLVLPWWYHYCQDVRNRPDADDKFVNATRVREFVLAEVELYKKRLNSKDVKFSELEKELMHAI